MKKIFILILFFIFSSKVFAHSNPVNDIALFCKVWGYLKYHSDFKDSFSYFDEFILTNIKQSSDINQDLLNKLIVDAYGKQLKKKVKAHDNFLYKTCNDSWITDNNFEPDLLKKLENYAHYTRNKVVDGTYNSSLKIDDYATFSDFKSISTKYLALFKLWNVVEYFYPQKWNMSVKWNDVLDKALINGLENEDILIKLEKMVSFMNDSHVLLLDLDYQKWYYGNNNFSVFPLHIELVDNKLYFINSYELDSLETLSGHEVVSYNGFLPEELIQLNKNLVSGSNLNSRNSIIENKINQSINHPALGDTTCTIRITEGEKVITKSFQRIIVDYTAVNNYADNIENSSEILRKNKILYINLIDKVNFRKELKKYLNDDYVLIDLRGYCKSDASNIAKTLSKKPRIVAKFNYNDPMFPGRYLEGTEVNYFMENKFTTLLKAVFSIKGKIFFTKPLPFKGTFIVLIDENSISYSETVGMILKAYNEDIKFVGRNSAGANGNVSSVKLPGNLIFQFTNLDFRFPDNAHIQGQGIIPDLFVKKEVGYSSRGKDEILE